MYSGKKSLSSSCVSATYFLSWETIYVFSFLYILSARVDRCRIKYIYIYMSTYISTNISVTPFTFFFLNQMAMYIMFIILLLAVFAIIHVLETSISISISVCSKFLWLHSILLYGYAMIYLISPLLVNSWVFAFIVLFLYLRVYDKLDIFIIRA